MKMKNNHFLEVLKSIEKAQQNAAAAFTSNITWGLMSQFLHSVSPLEHQSV